MGWGSLFCMEYYHDNMDRFMGHVVEPFTNDNLQVTWTFIHANYPKRLMLFKIESN